MTCHAMHCIEMSWLMATVAHFTKKWHNLKFNLSLKTFDLTTNNNNATSWFLRDILFEIRELSCNEENTLESALF